MAARRVEFLDTLRGLAAAAVVVFHLNVVGEFPPSAYLTFVKHGWLGVSVFFVLSGYSIHASVLRKPSVRTFVWRRFWRIYPPYLASLLVVCVIVVARKALTGTNDFITLPHTMLGWFEVLTLTTWPVGTTPNINWVYWTLSYEVAFYLWLALVLALPRVRWPLLFAPLVLSLTWHSAPVFFMDQWCLFGLGVALAEWQHERGLLPPLLAITCLVDAILHKVPGETVAGVMTMALVALASSGRGNFLNRIPLLPWVGSWSYSLYLTHVPIGAWLALTIDRHPRHASAASLPVHMAVDAFGLLASCAFAILFWKAVEIPAIAVAHGQAGFGRRPQPATA